MQLTVTGTAGGLRGQSFEAAAKQNKQNGRPKKLLAAGLIFLFAHFTSGGFSVHRDVSVHRAFAAILD